MTQQQAADFLLTHDDPDVRAAVTVLRRDKSELVEDLSHANKVVGLIRGVLQEVRLDLVALAHDLESTRRERDFLMEKHGG